VNDPMNGTAPDPEPAPGPEPDPQPDSAPEPAPAPAPRIPAEALSDRNEIARAKGLPGVMIRGGTDPDPEATRERERPYVRLLLVMIAVIVLAGFVLGFIGMAVGGPAPS
jgi:hypothetical protein